jgi:hypothetical protein
MENKMLPINVPISLATFKFVDHVLKFLDTLDEMGYVDGGKDYTNIVSADTITIHSHRMASDKRVIAHFAKNNVV